MSTKPLSKLQRRLALAGGIFFLALGGLGVLLPVLPTTPFLLLSAALFFRSSQRMYIWLIGNRLLGPFIHNYRRFRAVPLRAKVSGLVFLWLTIGYSVLFAVESWWLRGLLLVIALLVSRHILRLRTLTRAMLDEVRQAEDGDQPVPSAGTRAIID